MLWSLFFKGLLFDVGFVTLDGTGSTLFCTGQIAETGNLTLFAQIDDQRMGISGATLRTPESGLLQLVDFIGTVVAP